MLFSFNIYNVKAIFFFAVVSYLWCSYTSRCVNLINRNHRKICIYIIYETIWYWWLMLLLRPHISRQEIANLYHVMMFNFTVQQMILDNINGCIISSFQAPPYAEHELPVPGGEDHLLPGVQHHWPDNGHEHQCQQSYPVHRMFRPALCWESVWWGMCFKLVEDTVYCNMKKNRLMFYLCVGKR